MRADRLISILMLLQANGRMTAQDLADRLEVSPRTIYRDLDALSGAGVPVYAERGPHGGCMLIDSYRTNLTGLNENEVRALFTFVVPGLLADLGAAKAAEAALLKLTAALPAPFQKDAEKVRQRVYLDPAAWFQPEEPIPYLSLLQDAVWQERRVRMVYRLADGRWVRRLIDPYGLVAKTSTWYVVAASYNKPQVYRVSRVQEAQLTDGRFERPHDFDLARYWTTWRARFEKSRHRFPVTLRVPPAGITLLVQQFGEGVHHLVDAGAPAEDGCLLLSLTFETEADACRQLMGVATAVQVVTPTSLRRRMAETAQQLLAAYAVKE